MLKFTNSKILQIVVCCLIVIGWFNHVDATAQVRMVPPDLSLYGRNTVVFETPIYSGEIIEEDNSNLPKRILQVKAFNRNEDKPESFVYTLFGKLVDQKNSTNSSFSINPNTGEIYVLKPVDADVGSGGHIHLWFRVFAIDTVSQERLGTAEIYLVIKDINDNAPIFLQSNYEAYLDANSPENTTVLVINATDYDQQDARGEVSYKIVQNEFYNTGDDQSGARVEKPLFDIDSVHFWPNADKSGVIETRVCCFGNNKKSEYTIRIRASDNGGLESFVNVTIKIRKSNDTNNNNNDSLASIEN